MPNYDYPKLIGAFRSSGTLVSLSSNEDLFRQGDVADALFWLEGGGLEVSVLSEDGRKLSVNAMSAGTIFGEIGLIDDGPRSATVTATTTSQIRRLRRDILLAEMRKDPDLAMDLVRLCVDRLRWVSVQLEEQAFQPLSVRLARRVLYLLEKVGEERTLPMSQVMLSEHVGATREAVTKVISEWKSDGIVSSGRGKIIVDDLAALQSRAASG